MSAETPMEAKLLIDLLAGTGGVTFQTFDDAKLGRKGLTKVLHGSLAKHTERLEILNSKGAGVFFMVNGGDGLGRKAANVISVRALFVDLDGAPLQAVLDGPLMPHATVETSPDRFHAYWLVIGVPLQEFGLLQAALASRFGGDVKVRDLPRVMRLPGFMHSKGTPFMSRVLGISRGPAYPVQTFRQAFALADMASLTDASSSSPGLFIPSGQRNSKLFSLACGLVNKGHDRVGTAHRLQLINSRSCQPPLGPAEVETIAQSASAYGSSGFARLPHALLDSPEWKRLPHAARTIVIAAYRRYNGSNDGNISLPFADFAGEFGNNAFYRNRTYAIEAGFLKVTRKSSYSPRGGKLPDLFELGVKTTPNGRSEPHLTEGRSDTPT